MLAFFTWHYRNPKMLMSYLLHAQFPNRNPFFLDAKPTRLICCH